MRRLRWTNLVDADKAYHFARVVMDGRRRFTPHGHDFAEIIFVEKGSGMHVLNNQRCKMEAHDLVFIHPSDVHAIHARRDTGMQFFNVAFSGETFEFLRTRHGSLLPMILREGGEHRLRLSSRQARKVLLAVEEMTKDGNHVLALDRFLINLLYELSGPAVAEESLDCPVWLRQALEKIRDPEYFTKGSLGLVRLAGRSPEHVARVLRKLTGKTPTDVVNEARLEYAAGMLSATARPILEIALNCGFNSVSHFYELFKGKYGISPRRYRLKSNIIVVGE